MWKVHKDWSSTVGAGWLSAEEGSLQEMIMLVAREDSKLEGCGLEVDFEEGSP